MPLKLQTAVTLAITRNRINEANLETKEMQPILRLLADVYNKTRPQILEEFRHVFEDTPRDIFDGIDPTAKKEKRADA